MYLRQLSTSAAQPQPLAPVDVVISAWLSATPSELKCWYWQLWERGLRPPNLLMPQCASRTASRKAALGTTLLAVKKEPVQHISLANVQASLLLLAPSIKAHASYNGRQGRRKAGCLESKVTEQRDTAALRLPARLSSETLLASLPV